MTCPDPECHKGKERLENCVDEIKKELPKKVSRTGFIVNTIAVLSILSGFLLYALGSSATAKDERKANAAKAEVLETAQNLQFKNIKELITEFKDTQKEALRELKENQITTGDIYRIVKRVMKENGD